MAAEQLFSICNSIVLPGWLLLVVAPRWRWTQRIAALALPLALAAVYLTLVILHFRESGGGFGSLAQVSKLFENRYLLLAGWIHYLAFDLFTGSWLVRDAERLRIAHAYVVPCLLLTFLFGPVGLLTWFTDPDFAARALRDSMMRALRQLYESNPVLAVTGWMHWILAGGSDGARSRSIREPF